MPAGAYQVGTFGSLRWAEWNGRYRDDLRRFWRGDPHMIGPLATRLAGSSDLYQASGRRPYHSINFITSHDGFTLNDLVSYNHKHNEANGEQNRDGDNNNYSYNYGVEGPTTRRGDRDGSPSPDQEHAGVAAVEPGVPMLLFGDECRRTQQGNNNAYCQDNAISWFDWRLVRKNEHLLRFCQALMEFRKAEPTVRRTDFLTGLPVRPGGLPDVSWYGSAGDVDGLVERHNRPLLPIWGRAAARPGRAAQPSRADHVQCRQPTAGVCDSESGRNSGLVAVHRHGGAESAGHLSGPEGPAAGRRTGGIGGPLAHVFRRR